MDLRYRLAVVTGAGSGLGREVAVALSRAGAAVLVADLDLAAAEQTADLVRAARVRAWTFQVDLAEEAELRLLAARARDLGGMDLLVTLDLDAPAPARLTRLFVAQLADLRGRRDGTPAVVHVGSAADLAGLAAGCSDPATTGGARVMAVLPGWVPAADVTRAVVDLLRRGAAGQVVELPDGGHDRPEIAELVRTFFDAFASGPGVAARIDALREMFLPGAVVVRALDGEVTTYDVAGFLEPRRVLLEGGTLTGFSEWEVSGRTDVLGDVAVHVCGYAKQWAQDGRRHTGGGHKTLQLVRTPHGWRISALAWADSRE